MEGHVRNSRGERTREVILASAYSHVSRYGFDKTSIAQIVKDTGRPASSIYWLFKNKEELIAEAVEQSFGRANKSLVWEYFDDFRSCYDDLVVKLHEDFLVTDGEDSVRVGLMLALEGAARGLRVQEPFMGRRAKGHERFSGWWLEAFKSGGEASWVSFRFFYYPILTGWVR